MKVNVIIVNLEESCVQRAKKIEFSTETYEDCDSFKVLTNNLIFQ